MAGDATEASLMRTAAAGVAQAAREDLRESALVLPHSRVTGLIGPGKNGGDVLLALAELVLEVAQVRAVPLRRDARGRPDVHSEARAAFEAAGGHWADTIPANTDLVIDGLLGTGAPSSRSAQEAVAESTTSPDPSGLPAHLGAIPDTARVLACDLPSGLDPDTGARRDFVVPADVTVPLGALSPGLLDGPDVGAVGRLLPVVDIGAGAALDRRQAAVRCADEGFVGGVWTPPQREDHKYRRGVVAVVAGSNDYPGAGVLAVAGALAGGAGLVNLRAPGPVRRLVQGAHPEALAGRAELPADRVHAWVVGPGLGAANSARRRLEQAVAMASETAGPRAAVVDASAVDLITAEHLESLVDSGAHVVLTPHAGEWARLQKRLPATQTEGDAAADAAAMTEMPRRLLEVLTWARTHRVSVLLKGPRTWVADGRDAAAVPVLVTSGTADLAVGGTGDVLAGLIGAGLARHAALSADGEDAPAGVADVVAAAAWLHGEAGRDVAARAVLRASHLTDAVSARVAAIWQAGQAPEPSRTSRRAAGLAPQQPLADRRDSA